ncbi:MAG: hypothetical protein KDD00_17160 [Ignavibacteriae bacterium]|nr:hypothetical protein [Ignavibacteriota bacterium]
MKKLIFTLMMSLYFSISQSQIIQDYPFKTYLDNDNNLYITGNEQIGNSKDIFITKYPINDPLSYEWKTQIPNIYGDDRGFDLIVDDHGKVFVTGYSYNFNSSSNEIIIISLNSDGTQNWIRYLDFSYDDKGFGIDISKDENGTVEDVFITGYVTNALTGKDFFVKKFNKFGDSLWQSVYTYPGDQVATDILLDAGYAYVVGYTYAENETTSDMVIQSYDKLYGNLHDNHTNVINGSSEKPTGFCIPFPSGDPISKSRSAVTCLTDEIVNNNVRTSYLTVYFNPDLNNDLNPKWSRQTNVDNEFKENVPTAITSDLAGNIYVTGYMYNPLAGVYGSAGYDFATVKYSGETGNYLWNTNPLFINYNDTSSSGVDDKATSIKVNNKNHVLIAGTSQGSPNGYSIAIIEQQQRIPIQKYKKAFIPNFLDDGRSVNFNKWASLELTSDGTPILIAMGWNENESHWAAVKYDQSGNVEYTINNEPMNKMYDSDIMDLKNEINIYNTKSFKPVRNLK